MPLFSPPRETALFVEQTWPEWPPRLTVNVAPYEFISQATRPTADVLQPLAVIGDSFFDGMQRSGIESQFAKMYRAHWQEVRLHEFIAALPNGCRYAMIEFIDVTYGPFVALASMAPP